MEIQGKIVSNTKLNIYTQSLIVKPEQVKKIDFEAGQFMLLKLGENLQRAYSITNPPHQNDRLEFVIDTRPGGPGSQFALAAQKDDLVSLSGPFGKFRLRATDLPKVFIANGCGIPPLISMIEHLLHTGKTMPIKLYWGMRYQHELYFAERFRALKQTHSNFSYTFCITRPAKEEPFCATGRVTNVICLGIEENRKAEFYLCGKLAMIREMKTILTQHGIPSENVIHEGY